MGVVVVAAAAGVAVAVADVEVLLMARLLRHPREVRPQPAHPQLRRQPLEGAEAEAAVAVAVAAAAEPATVSRASAT